MNEQQQRAAAHRSGMSLEDWRAAKTRVVADRSRGRRPRDEKAELLRNWGQVDGQMGLFDVG